LLAVASWTRRCLTTSGWAPCLSPPAARDETALPPAGQGCIREGARHGGVHALLTRLGSALQRPVVPVSRFCASVPNYCVLTPLTAYVSTTNCLDTHKTEPMPQDLPAFALWRNSLALQMRKDFSTPRSSFYSPVLPPALWLKTSSTLIYSPLWPVFSAKDV